AFLEPGVLEAQPGAVALLNELVVLGVRGPDDVLRLQVARELERAVLDGRERARAAERGEQDEAPDHHRANARTSHDLLLSSAQRPRRFRLTCARLSRRLGPVLAPR